MAAFTNSDEALARRLAREENAAQARRLAAQSQSDHAFALRLQQQDQQNNRRPGVATVTGVAVSGPGPGAAVAGVPVSGHTQAQMPASTASTSAVTTPAHAAYGQHYPGAQQQRQQAPRSGMVTVNCHLCTSELECAANVTTYRCGVCQALNHRTTGSEAAVQQTQAALRARYEAAGSAAWQARTHQIPCPCCSTFVHVPTQARAFVCGQCRNYIARPVNANNELGLWAVSTPPGGYGGGLMGRGGYCGRYGRGYGYGRCGRGYGYGYGNGMLIGLTGAMFLTPWMFWPFWF